MPTYFQRPENALKRANEFIDVGKKQPALDALCDVIKSKKHRTWQKIHEPIMGKFLELCVDLRKSHVAKEGLYQYKNICQHVNVKSLEDVIRGYLQLAQDRTEAARQQSQQQVSDIGNIDDLDQLTTPESLLLSAVSGEDTQDRHDRVLLTPWVKFLWESYRQVLDLLRNNSRVERLYQDVAQQAFKFCINYQRKTEFRKLCDNLRSHLSLIQKHPNQSQSINLNNPESQAMHLETRLCQLDSAITMELWQEAYKAIEDIHGLMHLSKKPPKPQLMANYYQKLGLVFWKSGNHLYHASALHRLLHLYREQRKNLTTEEMQRMASRALLASLAVPLVTSSCGTMTQILDMREVSLEKKKRLATLLGVQSPPTRQQLIKDLVKHNVMSNVLPELAKLYDCLEVEFHPLRLCQQVAQILEWVEGCGEADLAQYVPAIQEVTVMRLLKQVSQVYHTIQFSRLVALAPFTTPFRLEKLAVEAARSQEVQVYIDHRTRSLQFGSDLKVSQVEQEQEGPRLQAMPSELIRSQLTRLSSSLQAAVAVVAPDLHRKDRDTLRQQVVQRYFKANKKEHARILSRRQVIEDRKEHLENLNVLKVKEEQDQLDREQKAAAKAEKARLSQEAAEREKAKKHEELKLIQQQQTLDKIENLKKTAVGSRTLKKLDMTELKEMNVDDIVAKQVEQLELEKKELLQRLKAQEKRVDHFARAKRVEEIPLLTKQSSQQQVKDKEFWNQQEDERVSRLKVEQEVNLKESRRLTRMRTDKDQFLNNLKDTRRSFYKEKMANFEHLMLEERQKRLEKRRERRKNERRQKWVAEREEEAQRQRDQELKREREEKETQERERREKEEEAYLEKKKKLDEIAAKQRERERQIEERAKDRSLNDSPRDQVDGRDGRGGEGEWRKVPGGEEGSRSWRDRQDGGGAGGGADGGEEQAWRPAGRPGGWRDREQKREESYSRPPPPRPESSWRGRDERQDERRDDRWGGREEGGPTRDRGGHDERWGPSRDDRRDRGGRDDRWGGREEGGPPRDDRRGDRWRDDGPSRDRPRERWPRDDGPSRDGPREGGRWSREEGGPPRWPKEEGGGKWRQDDGPHERGGNDGWRSRESRPPPRDSNENGSGNAWRSRPN